MIPDPLAAAGVIAAVISGVAAGHFLLRRAAAMRSCSGSERLFARLAVGFMLVSAVAVLLADLGLLRVSHLLVTTVAAALAAWVGSGPAALAVPGPKRVDSGWLMVPLLVVLIYLQAFPTFDTRLEARDPGVYRFVSARVQASGSLAYVDPLVADMTPELRDAFFPINWITDENGKPIHLSPSRAVGFYLENRDTGRVVPQFLPLAPVMMALARHVGGPMAGAAAGAVAAFVAAFGLFFLGRRIANGVAGAVAAVWLTICLIQWWNIRYGTAEPFAQALFVIGCYFLLVERETDSEIHGWVAGGALGLLWFTKVELLLLGAPLGLLFVADTLGGRMRVRSTQAYWAALAALGSLFFVQAWGWSYPYVHDVLLVPGTTIEVITGVAAAALLIACGAAAWSLRARQVPLASLTELMDPTGRRGRRARLVLAVALVLLAVYGYAFRAPGWDEYNVRELGWVVSLPALLLAVTGAVWLLLERSPRRGIGTLLVVAVPTALLVLYNKQIVPDLLWAYRRYMPVVLPLVLLGAGVTVGRTIEWARSARANGGRAGRLGVGAAAVAVAVAITALQWQVARPYRDVRELAGSGGLIRELAAAIEPNALVLVEARTRRGLMRLEGVLQHELGRQVLRLPAPELDPDVVQAVLFTASRRGHPVYLLTTGYLVGAEWFGADRVGEFTLETSRLEETFQALPAASQRIYINARLYRIRLGERLAPLEGQLDVGGVDDLYLDGRTMFQAEVEAGGRNFRWANGLGRIYLPGLEPGTPRMLIRMASGYPPERGEQVVTVRLDGTIMGQHAVGRGWVDYEFFIPPEWEPPGTGMPLLELEVDPVWRPGQLFGVEDRREVGIAVDLIRWGQ